MHVTVAFEETNCPSTMFLPVLEIENYFPPLYGGNKGPLLDFLFNLYMT